MYDVITVGSSTVDVFAKTKSSGLIKIMDSKGETDLLAYPTGAKILVTELDFTTGGGGTNTAVSLARLGHKAAYLGKMGSGNNAQRIISELKKEKVDTSLVVCSKNGRTGYSIILDSIEHDRTILAFKGSNNDLRFSEIKLGKLKTKWFYFSTMLSDAYETQEKLAKFAEKNNIKIAFNASSYLAKKGFKFLENILSRTNIFILNKEEASLIVKGSKIEELLKGLYKLGPKIVAITEGKKGASAFDGKTVYTIKTHNIKIVETTGAGDAFASSFLSGIIKKNDIGFAMQLGQTNAESVISYHGAKNKLLKYNEALKIIKRCPSKIKKKKLR
jgi:ribokinase